MVYFGQGSSGIDFVIKPIRFYNDFVTNVMKLAKNGTAKENHLGSVT